MREKQQKNNTQRNNNKLYTKKYLMCITKTKTYEEKQI